MGSEVPVGTGVWVGGREAVELEEGEKMEAVGMEENVLGKDAEADRDTNSGVAVWNWEGGAEKVASAEKEGDRDMKEVMVW